jgi:hypothetical protein
MSADNQIYRGFRATYHYDPLNAEALKPERKKPREAHLVRTKGRKRHGRGSPLDRRRIIVTQ